MSVKLLNAEIQIDGHNSSVLDARACLAIYRMYYKEDKIDPQEINLVARYSTTNKLKEIES